MFATPDRVSDRTSTKAAGRDHAGRTGNMSSGNSERRSRDGNHVDGKIDLDRISRFVNQQLCDLGQLEPGQFPITQRIVSRRGQQCGMYFCLHGPRSVKLTAICDLEREHVIFYGVDGVRSAEARFSEM